MPADGWKRVVERLRERPRLWTFIRLGAGPALLYLAWFAILTFPLLWWFSSYYFADDGDGLQNVWNLWWVDTAITELGQLPWHTDYLHHPWGVSLLAHTLNPFNGFVGIALQTVLSLVQTHNLIVVFSFVMGGVTAFWLALYVTRAYWPSLVAGFVFTFSNFHFAHAEGHLQLVSLEWIPLFLLAWLVLLARPSWRLALAAALALFLVFLCDYYYFFYCVIAGALILFWQAFRARTWRYLIEPRRLKALGVFVAAVLVTAGPLTLALVALNARDPLEGVHDPLRWSADLFSFVIPGGHWWYSHWTFFFWGRLPGNAHEKSVHLGLTVIALLVFVVVRRRGARAELGVWWLLFGFFAVMALGPVLQVFGSPISWLKLPYALFELLFPPLEMSGCPVRMAVMVSLAAGVLSAAAFDMLLSRGRRGRVLAALLFSVLVFEYWPRPIPATRLEAPEYVEYLASLPEEATVVDWASEVGHVLYFQTIHEKRMGLGYISRYPSSLMERERRLKTAIRRRDYRRLHEKWDIHYLAHKAGRDIVVIDTASGAEVFRAPREEAIVAESAIRIGLSLVEVERLDDRWKVLLELRFTNTGDDVFDLDKATACDGGFVSNHVFDVRLGGIEIDYQGMMKKRAPPGSDGFFHIQPGESVSLQVDIGEHYDLPTSGDIEVRFDHYNHFSKDGVQLVSNTVIVPLR